MFLAFDPRPSTFSSLLLLHDSQPRLMVGNDGIVTTVGLL
jgi:hypothetical protein